MEYAGLGSCLACCECGTPISYNAVNMCEPCMENLVDITKSINNQIVISHCFTCSRFLSPPSMWIPANNTQQLLNACLKLIKGLHKFRVKDAKFLWTEPHSKRLKVELTVQQDVSNTSYAPGNLCGGAAVEQTKVIEYIMHSHICDECQREAAKDYWSACVQVRQKTKHKKTMYFMEQIILKYNAHKECLNIKKVAGGVDFFFMSKSHAYSLVQFLQKRLPVRYEESKKLIGHDIGNSTYNFKYTFRVDLPTVCKDDLVCLSKSFAQKLGNLNQLCIVNRITDQIHLIDPVTAKTRHFDANVFYQNEFHPIGSSRNLTRFLVVDSEKSPVAIQKPGDCPVSAKHSVHDAYVCRSNDMSEQVHVRSHLGNIMQPGDEFLGIDLRSINCNDSEFDKLDSDKIPDVILIKKFYDRTLRKRVRQWRLNRLPLEDGSVTNTDGDDLQDFHEDIEEDPEIRAHINLYHKKITTEADCDRDQLEGLPMVPLEELLQGLDLSDRPEIPVEPVPQAEHEMMDM